VIRNLAESHSSESPQLIDGVRVIDKSGWVLALPDGGRPVIKIYAEGKSADIRDRKLKKLKMEIKKILRAEKK
jgi:phosphomannomutase